MKVLVEASDESESDEADRDHHDPSADVPSEAELATPKEAAAVLAKRFQVLLRAGRHSSGSRYQLAVHAGRMSDDDWQRLQEMASKERGWSIERNRVGSERYEVKACYHWVPANASAAATERPLQHQHTLLARLDSQSRSAVSSLKRQREEGAAPVPSATERERTARRVVARHLWLLARDSKSCQMDELLDQVLAHSDLAEEAALAALEQIVIRRDKLQKHLVRLEGDTLMLVPPTT